jgi:UDP-2-acetamido-3-amino-2,3-dideoxy-glucuronate N-acetyltransferase
MSDLRKGQGVITGAKVKWGKDIVVWNYVVIGDNTRVGDGTSIGSFCDIGKNVVIGKHCNIQAHVTISNGCLIGDNVFIAPNSTLLNDKYPKSNLMTPPVVKDNVIIGGGVTILPGVVIGENSVVGGGSVVTKNVPPRSVSAGVPSREIMTLEEYEAKRADFIRAKHRVGQ